MHGFLNQEPGLLLWAGLGVGLAMDAFAVATSTSLMLRQVSKRQVFRFGFHFGLFQAMMPIIGWFAGKTVHEYIAAWDHWVAFGLLAFIGFKAIVDTILRGEEPALEHDPTRGLSLVVFSVATSIDALAVGLSLALVGVAIWTPALVIGVVTSLLTTLGMLIGARIGARLGRGAAIFGGVVLILIGVRILVSHLV